MRRRRRKKNLLRLGSVLASPVATVIGDGVGPVGDGGSGVGSDVGGVGGGDVSGVGGGDVSSVGKDGGGDGVVLAGSPGSVVTDGVDCPGVRQGSDSWKQKTTHR